MRFPSVSQLYDRATAVLRRFPWTLAWAMVAAVAAIRLVHIQGHADSNATWMRLMMVAALGIPGSIALTLTAETRRLSPALNLLLQLALAGVLYLFYQSWPGPDGPVYQGFRYLQLSAVLHLLVAFLPFAGIPESVAFWQYNRRLLEGFVRAAIYSAVLLAGSEVVLAALDHLFGLSIRNEWYFDLLLVTAFVANTWMFLATVPDSLESLAGDDSYPRSLKILAQYILTPLAFTYLVLLLAYLVKIVIGGEWPRGWIGWLVGSVSVTGLLGFLLVHPLREDPAEGWIRTYTRWLFVGLIPAALMLLVAFWKRIEPYGLTELRVLGLALGVWLLGIAILFTVRSGASIRWIPISLAALLLVTLQGPVSLSRLSVASQARRLAHKLAPGTSDAAEASAALRFLIEHKADRAIASAIGRDLPPIDWARTRWQHDSLGSQILALVDVRYVPRQATGGWFNVTGSQPLDVAGMEWMIPTSSHDTTTRTAGGLAVKLLPQGSGVERYGNGIERFLVGTDTLVFDLRPFARGQGNRGSNQESPEALRVDAAGNGWKGALVLNYLNGRLQGDSVEVSQWTGMLLIGRNAAN